MKKITLDELCRDVTAFVEQQDQLQNPQLADSPLPPVTRIRAIRAACDEIWWHSVGRALALAGPPDGRAA